VIREVLHAIHTVVPYRRPWLRYRPRSPVVEVTSSFLEWPHVIPQHGRGRKHMRPPSCCSHGSTTSSLVTLPILSVD